MTETQATSGAAGTSTNPVDSEHADGQAAGRAAVGRATVPASESPDNTGSVPKYTRAPGMPPPPDAPEENGAGRTAEHIAPTSGAGGHTSATAAVPPPVSATATVPVVSPMMGNFAPASVSSPPATAPGGRPGARPAATGRVALGPTTTAVRVAPGAGRTSEALRATRSSGKDSRGPRRARLNVKRIDPWSVMKFSCAVSVVLFIVIIVATSVLYLALDAMGVFDSVNSTLSDMVGATGGADGAGGFKITAKGVIGTAALLGAVNVVLFTALATLSAFVYNVCADLVGGIELTLSERD